LQGQEWHDSSEKVSLFKVLPVGCVIKYVVRTNN